MPPVSRDKIRACFILGACGDTLGAPLEPIRSIADIFNTYGQQGLSEIIPFTNVFDTGEDLPAGRLTDDTTMAMTVAAAVAMTLKKHRPDSDDFDHALRKNLWQGFLNWGQHQDGAAHLAAKIDKNIDWPETVKPFWFHCGAGRGTIASLQQDAPGSFVRPQNYDLVIRGKKTKSPNRGCGGMMRVAPVAFLDLPPEKIFETACGSAVLTNGHPEAYVAAGIIALYVRFAAEGKDILAETEKVLLGFEKHPFYKDGIPGCFAAMAAALQPAAGVAKNIDALPRMIGYSNPFLAIPVLAQVTYALRDVKDVKSAMVLAVNHGGDSDSVGAIVGNILGAKYGSGVIPPEWEKKLIQHNDIEKMVNFFAKSISPPPPSPPRLQP